MKPSRYFASDNNSGVHPNILKAIEQANVGHVVAYGGDPYTISVMEKFRQHFGEDIDVHLVFNGTGANVLSIVGITCSYNAVLCSEYAHLNVDECGAPEKLSGCKLLPVQTVDGKMNLKDITGKLKGLGDQHHVQPKVISLSQTTELGTVYSVEELKSIADFAHANNMLLHMDGARISNAAASMGRSLREVTRDVGVDILSFGGTKNGMMYGEAVIFFNSSISENFKYVRKQGMQLASKMRFIAVQFESMLSDDLWLKNATHANMMAKLLEQELRKQTDVEITRPTQANAVFARLDPRHIPLIQEKYFFHVWDKPSSEVRWMTSFDTTKEDVMDFVANVRTITG